MCSLEAQSPDLVFYFPSNVDRLRDFIKHVYVDKRYSGDRSFDRPPRAKVGAVLLKLLSC